MRNQATSQHAIWLLSNGVFTSAITLPTVPIQWRVAGVGDFTNNGFDDLVLENTSTGARAIWLLQNGVFSSSIDLPAVLAEPQIGKH